MTRVADKRDETMIASPMGWPRWPMLPLKRRSQDGNLGEVGFLLDAEGHELTVYEHNIFGLDQLDGETVGDQLRNIPVKHKYETVKALLNGGWYVD